jgi:hypothetical protein
VSAARITHRPRSDTTQWPGPRVLAAIYARAIERFEEIEKATGAGGPDDANKEFGRRRP